MLTTLLQAISTGDRSAFRRLYELTAHQLFASAVRILEDNDEAAEALQDAYLRIWWRSAEFDPERGTATTWLNAVLRNAAIDRLRRRRRAQLVEDGAAAPSEEPRPSESDGDIWHCLRGLEPAQAEIIVKAFFEGLTHSELAAELDLPLGTIKSRIKRGLARLKECLDRDDR